jgi:predicted flap endonuclease-1-like 5' DNA nuclease
MDMKLSELGPVEKEVYELIKRTGEIMTVQIPATKAGAIPSLVNKGLIELVKRRASTWKEKKAKFVKVSTSEAKEKEEVKHQAQMDTSMEDSIEQISKEELFDEDISMLDGVGSKYQELLRASGYRNLDSIAESPPKVLHAKLIEVNNEKEITKRSPTLSNVEKWVSAAKSRLD